MSPDFKVDELQAPSTTNPIEDSNGRVFASNCAHGISLIAFPIFVAGAPSIPLGGGGLAINEKLHAMNVKPTRPTSLPMSVLHHPHRQEPQSLLSASMSSFPAVSTAGHTGLQQSRVYSTPRPSSGPTRGSTEDVSASAGIMLAKRVALMRREMLSNKSDPTSRCSNVGQ